MIPEPLPREPAPQPSVTDLDALLAAGLRRDLSGTVFARRRARLLLTSDASDAWTVDVGEGTAVARRGAAPAPTARVHGSAAALADLVAGRASAAEGFLEGRLAVRGDLGMVLQADVLFAPDTPRPPSAPRAHAGDVMGVRTSWLEAGPAGAPPVVLLHGLGATGASMLPLLVDLARDSRVLLPDVPGSGSSAAPASPYSSAWFAAWLAAFLTTTGSRGAVLVGNSLGGRIALEAGLAAPGAVRALVLLAPSPAFRRLREYVPVVRLLPPLLAALPVPPVSHRLVVEVLRGMMSVPDRLPAAWYDAVADEAVRVYRSRGHRVAFLGAARQIYLEEAHGRRGFWDRLAGLQPPALFVWGDRDRLVPASFARHVADVLPGAASVVLEDCGHAPQYEQPEDTTALVRAFLETVPVAVPVAAPAAVPGGLLAAAPAAAAGGGAARHT